MSTSDPTIDDIRRSIRHTVRLHWQLFLAQGVITIILGVLAIIWPQVSSVAVDVYIGLLFLLAGLMGLVLMLYAPTTSSFTWALLTAALSLLVGVLLLWHPVEGTISLTLVLIAFFIAEGLFQSLASIHYREIFPESWGWMLASGIADLVLAAVIIAGWPEIASWTLGLIVGVNLITSGAATTMIAVATQSVARTVQMAMR